jgi:predicted ribosome quality control (RQC) complex YloA/Tae2 family protein
MQPVDVTTLSAVREELRSNWLPARVEQLRQEDSFTVEILLRTLHQSAWLVCSHHPQSARIHIRQFRERGPAPKSPNPQAFISQLQDCLQGKVLVQIEQPAWERVLILHFASRPDEPVTHRLYVEIMGKYSNLVLTDADAPNIILNCAHVVTDSQSRLRPMGPGDRYTPPPPLTSPEPSLATPFTVWQARVSLLPKSLDQMLIQSYRGISKSLTHQMLAQAQIPSTAKTQDLSEAQWQALFFAWTDWLTTMQSGLFKPCLHATGYSVLGWGCALTSVQTASAVLDQYYSQTIYAEAFKNQRSRMMQVIQGALTKLAKKEAEFKERLLQAQDCALFRQKGDLLKANLHKIQPGQKVARLTDPNTGERFSIAIDPAKDAMTNAQQYYKRHRKAKRAQEIIVPLLESVYREQHYLATVQTALEQMEQDLESLQEVQSELEEAQYLKVNPKNRPFRKTKTVFHGYLTPSGLKIWVGRNNRQNEDLSFKVAAPNDLWFHAQEIPGSHVVLQIPPGTIPQEEDLAAAAAAAAYHSRSRQESKVPVAYTECHHLRKLKGPLPGLVTYETFQVMWGVPDRVKDLSPSPSS